jgi:uncharacterized protein YxjI
MNATPSPQPLEALLLVSRLFVRQKFEPWELLGVESRNHYEIREENGSPFAIAAELRKGAWDFFSRQLLGHNRSYEIHFSTPSKDVFLIAHHPFCWWFHRLEIRTPQGRFLGTIRWRFSFFSKFLEIENEMGAAILQARAPLWKPWTFTFSHLDREVASVKKRWSGLLSEVFSDRDNFQIEFLAPDLPASDRSLILAAAVFIDMLYFEKKQSINPASTATDLLFDT